ncbi:MAG: chloride channel protein, partial [Caldilineaceae bacterium]|nr:chloride channel protein [Caldilineaceae bacterium]
GLTIGRLLMMALAGLLVGYMVARWASEAKGHGVPEVMEAMAIRGGRIRPRVAAVKVLASSLTIGTGGSAGREGPIVQVGSALGSTLGQVFGFSEERVRTLVACGAAAGIASTFNAPIAGAIFALEVIAGTFTIRYFGAVVISSVTAAVVSRSLLGDRPAFTVPAYALSHLGELPIYIVLGVLAALVAVFYIRFLYLAEDLFDRWKMPLPFKAALGMALTGAVALLLPERNVLGPGLHAIGEAIAENFHLSLGLMAALLILKLLATTLTLASGNSGGVFAPSLFMGAVLGGMVGTVAHMFWPTVAVNPGAYAIVGMAAVFSSSARAPITAILIVFEMSNDYKLILPLMLATVLATLLAELLFRDSIYTLKLRLKGISLQRGRDVDVLESLLVEEVMVEKMETVRTDTTLVEVSDLFAETHSHGFPVLDENGALWGIVTVSDLDRVVADELPRRTPVADFATPRSRLLTATPNESVSEALTRMGTRGIGRLPVVAVDDPAQLIGWIRRDDIIRAYNMAITRRAELQHRTKRMQLRNLDNTEFLEIELKAGDQAINKTIQDVAPKLPKECILVSIRRNGKMMIPHGDTTLQIGDRITAFVAVRDAKAVHACLRKTIT